MSDFTHFDSKGNAVMVDVSRKAETTRLAIAVGNIRMSSDCYHTVKSGDMQKGDVLGVARIAGIQAVKQTAALIPLCHSLPIEEARIEFACIDESNTITAECTVKTAGKTGVEMEALTGVSIALLTIYDMCKAMDKGMEMGPIYLQEKHGGKSGSYVKEP